MSLNDAAPIRLMFVRAPLRVIGVRKLPVESPAVWQAVGVGIDFEAGIAQQVSCSNGRAGKQCKQQRCGQRDGQALNCRSAGRQPGAQRRL